MSVTETSEPNTTPAAPSDRGYAALEVRDLSVFHGPLAAVRDVSFRLDGPGALGVLGRNGAGKTTLLSGLMGILPSTGHQLLEGIEVSGHPAWRRARAGLALVPQGRQLLADLSVEENLRLAELEPKGSGPQFDVHELFPKLRMMRKRKAGYLSGGEQQQAAIARGLLRRPTVLLLDEPTEGLAPAVIAQIAAVLKELLERGLTFVLAEQHHHVVADLCSSVLVLRGGEVAAYEETSAAALERYTASL